MPVDDVRVEVRHAAEALAAVPLFSGLSPVDLAKLAGVLEERWLDAGSTVFEAGEEGDALYVLREGTAERRVAGSALELVHPPAIFGELALITNAGRSATVAAVTPLRLWVLPRARFAPLLRAEPELMLHLSAAVGLDLARTRRALGELQGELDEWLSNRLDALSEEERELTEAAAFFERPSLRALQRLAPMELALPHLQALARTSGLWQSDASGVYVPPAIGRALRRYVRGAHRERAIQTRLGAIARQLEREGYTDDAALTYRAAGAESDALRISGAVKENAGVNPSDSHAAPASAAATAPARGNRGFALRSKRLWLIVSIVPLLFWTMAPPADLSVAGWRMLLTVLSAAVLFASEALPEAVVGLALLAVWVITGIAEPRLALEGFATQAWVLVLAVLAIGVAVGDSGLLYRVALIALGRKRASYATRCMTLALVGTAVTPTLPNATSRMALAAPLVREISAAMGYAPRERAATGLALAALIGFGQMSGLFLTGSSVGLLLHGLLPEAARGEIGFTGWILAALPLHVVLFASSMLTMIALYRPQDPQPDSTQRLALQHEVLGPMRRDEAWCLVVLVALIVGFLTEPLHGIHGAWLGVAALVVLAAAGRLDAGMLRTGVNWNFLVFFGVLTSLAAVFSALQIDTWLAAKLDGPVQTFAGQPLIFCIALAVVGYALAFVVRWQAAAPLLTLAAMPVAGTVGIHPFVVALISLVSTQVWFVPSQSTVYLALYHGSGELFTHRSVRRMAWIWGALVLMAIAAAVPVWQWMGMIR